MPVRKFQTYELNQEEKETISYQEYVPETSSTTSLKEVLFFVNIACFCIFLALFSFIFLALKLNTVLAFAMAIVFSLASLKLQRLFIKKKFHH